MDDDAALAEIRHAAQAALDAWPEARAAVLFGSRARGNHRPDSDWDVAFIVRGDGERLESIPSGVPFSVPGVQRSHYVNEIAIPERLVARKALCIGHVGRGIVTDGRLLAGDWTRPEPEGEPFMETGRYRKSMHASLDAVGIAIEAAAEIERQDVWERNLAITDRFVACTADAAEHLAKAVMGRHGLDARHSHDLHRLADQARNAGHDALAEDFRRMNGATRTDHVARYDGATQKSLARAIARLPVVLDLMRKELADIPESFLDPAEAGRLADTAARLLSNGAGSLRDAIQRDGTDMQPPEPYGWLKPLIASREPFASTLDATADALREGSRVPDKDLQDRELQLACALTERIAPSPDESDFHRRLPKPVQDTLAAASKAVGVSQEAIDELAAEIARARAEADVRVELTQEFSDSPLHEFRARFEGHPRFSRGDMLTPYDAAIKERMKDLDRNGVVPDDLERIVARAAVASAGTGNEDTARKMVQALKCGTVPDAEEIRTRQKALLADLAQPGENETDADRDRLAQEVYRCFTLEETHQICEGRGPFIQTLASDADRSRVTAGFRALHDFEIVGPAPWAGLHRTMQSTLAERNAPGERLAGRSDPAEASRFPTRNK